MMMVILRDLESPVLTMSVINLSSLVGMGIGYRVFLSGYMYILICIVLLHKFKMFSMEKEVYTEITNEGVIIFTE